MIIYEDSDSWWTKHSGEVCCVISFLGILAAVAWGLMFP